MYLCIIVSMYLCIYISLYLCIIVSLYLCIYVSMHLWIYASMDLSIDLSVYLSICLSIYLSIYLFICLSVYLSILSIYLSIYLSIHVSMYPCMYACMHVCMYRHVMECHVLWYNALLCDVLFCFGMVCHVLPCSFNYVCIDTDIHTCPFFWVHLKAQQHLGVDFQFRRLLTFICITSEIIWNCSYTIYIYCIIMFNHVYTYIHIYINYIYICGCIKIYILLMDNWRNMIIYIITTIWYNLPWCYVKAPKMAKQKNKCRQICHGEFWHSRQCWMDTNYMFDWYL